MQMTFRKLRYRILLLISFCKLLLQLYSKTDRVFLEKQLWSKAYGLRSDTNGGLLNIALPSEVLVPSWLFRLLYRNPKGTVWLRMGSRDKRKLSSHLKYFHKYVLPTLKEEITLFTSDGDTNIPKDVPSYILEDIVSSRFVKSWHAQNVCADNNIDKLKPIPIGLDLHFDRGNGVGINTFRSLVANQILFKRRQKVLVDCCINITNPVRKTIFDELYNDTHFHFLDSFVPQSELYEMYKRYEIVLSVEGNGYDCHRTYEALACGAQVILLAPNLSQLTYSHPRLWRANDLNELKKLSKSILQRT